MTFRWLVLWLYGSDPKSTTHATNGRISQAQYGRRGVDFSLPSGTARTQSLAYHRGE